jgi:hypothetical protein
VAESPAALLRQAEALIREQLRTVPPSPWQQDGRTVVKYGPLDGPHGIASCQNAAQAAYVLGWQPAAAKAVADLLGELAWMIGMQPDTVGRVGCDEANAIARAILGVSNG